MRVPFISLKIINHSNIFGLYLYWYTLEIISTKRHMHSRSRKNQGGRKKFDIHLATLRLCHWADLLAEHSFLTRRLFTHWNSTWNPLTQKIQITKPRRFKNGERRSAFNDHCCNDSRYIYAKNRSFFQRMRLMCDLSFQSNSKTT